MQSKPRGWTRLAALLLASLTITVAGLNAQVYKPTWHSVDRHNPAPEWYQDAKFGIYFHWGAFSVPACCVHGEWYGNLMLESGSPENLNQLKNYGDPFTVFTYDKFITGQDDLHGHFTQFAPRLKSSGGNFDPDAWAQLFADAGARWAGPVTIFHDGYVLFDSTANEWNTVHYGPNLDLLGVLATAIRSRNLKLYTSWHNAYNFTGYWFDMPRQKDRSLRKLYGQLPKAEEDQLWLTELREAIDQQHPDIMYHDFNLYKIDVKKRLDYLADYYNDAVKQGKDVVVTYKIYDPHGFDKKGELVVYERGGPFNIVSPYWLDSESIAEGTWGYIEKIKYFSAKALIDALIDRVSKNGNMQLNIAPMADGTIPQEQKNILAAIGAQLNTFGEGIFSTRAWLAAGVFGEGPTRLGGMFTKPIEGTNKDIRFTVNKAGDTLYATVMGWPGDGAQLIITTLGSSHIDLRTLNSVALLSATVGTYINLQYFQDGQGLKVTMPNIQPHTAAAYVLKLTFAGKIPPYMQPD
jgi:alpha-L-fucosidase